MSETMNDDKTYNNNYGEKGEMTRGGGGVGGGREAAGVGERRADVSWIPANGATASVTHHLELFVRAGKDGESLGGCPLCQRIFIILLIKAKASVLTFTVTTVNMTKPPPDFKKLASRLPVIIDGLEIFSDPDEIIQYLDERFPLPTLSYDNVKASQVCMDVFSKFSFYIKDVSHSSSLLMAELQRLNNYLEESPHRFLCRDSPDHLDCIMLPKLQHIRVVAKAFKNFDIPKDFKGLWSYLANAYSSDFFQQTCPTDEEIVHHWQCKPECPPMSKDRLQALQGRARSRRSLDIPHGVFPRQGSNDSR